MAIEGAGRTADSRFDGSRLAAIVESSADAIISKTLDGVITTWNGGAAQMYGYTAGEMIGRNVSELIPPDRAGELGPILARLRQGERVEHFETKRVRKDGSIVDVSVSVSPIRDSGGVVAGASTVARDMTERNQAEALRRALEQELHQSERLEALGQLAGGIAHDFNNLLSAIMNYAGFVAEQAAEPAVRHDAEQIQAAAQRAAALTRQLLIFSRREAAQAEALDLNAIIADIRDLLSRSIGAHIDLRAELAPDLAAILADRGQVEQVLLNLAINARDAMPEGGFLTIGTKFAELDAEHAARLRPCVSPGGYTELTVSDTGTGMTAEVAARIFEPFFTTKPVGQGTGLGLSTVHGIVTQASGSMSVCSEEGTGTTFHIYFPGTSAALRAAPASAAPAARGGGETILVVDDEPAVLDVASRILRNNGYATLEARTCEEALSLAGSHDFQLLLTDSVMPGMSGASLSERVAALRPGLPVLHMSGYSDGVLDPQAIRVGELAFVQKPFTAQALLEKVHAALCALPSA